MDETLPRRRGGATLHATWFRDILPPDVTEVVTAMRWVGVSPEDGAQALGVVMALLLGALQGIAEFLPISSSGHLALANAYLGIDPSAGGHTFAIAVHAGTLLSVVVVYRQELGALLRGLPAGDDTARRLLLALVVGSLPLGAMLIRPLRETIVRLEGDVQIVACLLLVTAVLLGLGQAWRARRRRAAVARVDAGHSAPTVPHPHVGDDLERARAAHPRAGSDAAQTIPSWRQALLIGVFQLFAVLPGISRAGSTIAGGLAVGLDDDDAARFSFLLSIPAVFAATGLELLSLLRAAPGHDAGVSPSALGVGFVAAFAVGTVALTSLLALLRRAGLAVFIPYLVLVATLALLFPPPG